jgi:sulfite reductase (NADPH) hemoprotein beta-component
MLAELGLVGKAVGRYNVYIGGNRAGTRIPKLHMENATTDAILSEVDVLVGRWANERNGGEEFGDFAIRAGIVEEVTNGAVDFWT